MSECIGVGEEEGTPLPAWKLFGKYGTYLDTFENNRANQKMKTFLRSY